MGFVTCDTFGNGIVKEQPDIYLTATRLCPRCERQEGRRWAGHDANMVRMVVAKGWGLKWGVGPDKEDWGWEVRCKSGCVVL